MQVNIQKALDGGDWRKALALLSCCDDSQIKSLYSHDLLFYIFDCLLLVCEDSVVQHGMGFLKKETYHQKRDCQTDNKHILEFFNTTPPEHIQAALIKSKKKLDRRRKREDLERDRAFRREVKEWKERQKEKMK